MGLFLFKPLPWRRTAFTIAITPTHLWEIYSWKFKFTETAWFHKLHEFVSNNLGFESCNACCNMLQPCQMSKELEAKSGAMLVWQDMTKYGKVSGKELDGMTNSMAHALRLQPAKSAGFITCPVLVSTVANNIRDEMRRFEDKLDAKGLSNYLISLRVEIPPSTKKVPITFYGWLVMDGGSEGSNIFTGSQLFHDRRCSLCFHPSFVISSDLLNWELLSMRRSPWKQLQGTVFFDHSPKIAWNSFPWACHPEKIQETVSLDHPEKMHGADYPEQVTPKGHQLRPWDILCGANSRTWCPAPCQWRDEDRLEISGGLIFPWVAWPKHSRRFQRSFGFGWTLSLRT